MKREWNILSDREVMDNQPSHKLYKAVLRIFIKINLSLKKVNKKPSKKQKSNLF